MKKKELEFLAPDLKTKLKLQISDATVSAGFPSPAEDYDINTLDLNEFLIKNPSTTFLVRVNGDSMEDAGIFKGDILIVDRTIQPKNGDIVIAMIDNDFLVKRLKIKDERFYLVPANNSYKEINIKSNQSFAVWGVVIYNIHKF